MVNPKKQAIKINNDSNLSASHPPTGRTSVAITIKPAVRKPASTVFLPSFLVDFFALDKVDAGFRTAGFIVIATLVRPVGGWLADKFEPLFILMACFLGLTIASAILAFSPAIHLYTVGT